MVGFVSLVLSGVLRAAPLRSGPWCASWSAACSGGLFGLLCRPVMAAKRAAHSSRPSWVGFWCWSVLAGNAEGLSFRRRQPPGAFQSRWSTSLPFVNSGCAMGLLNAGSSGLVSSLVGDGLMGRTRRPARLLLSGFSPCSRRRRRSPDRLLAKSRLLFWSGRPVP